MSAPVVIALVYLGQLWFKAALALCVRGREKSAPAADLRRLTIIQPVTSGDATLAAVLLETVEVFAGASIIWIVDRPDQAARELCSSLAATHPSVRILVLEADEPPEGMNPKLWKQVAAIARVETELLAVIDDDTRVPRRSADALVCALDAGADLATGLPSYAAAPGVWSPLVAEWVNSSAILTYLSAAACAEPLSINGMCYAMRTGYVRLHDLFAACGRSVTDDLALAKAVRSRGGRLVQTSRPQHITTEVKTLRHYRRLMHRWFVMTRVLVQSEPVGNRILLVLAYGVHPLLLAALFAYAPHHPWPLFAVLAARSATLALLNRSLVGAWRHSPLASIAAELLQPVFFVGALLSSDVWWRRRRIRVRDFDRFEYLSP